MDRRPLVVDDGELEQLQPEDDLDIPLQDKHDMLVHDMKILVTSLVELGLEIDPRLYKYVEG
jgi:hypothetical protein